MMSGRILAAGTAYAGLVFVAGFALGSIREILVRPYFGASASRLAELPLMIGISYLAARFVTRRMEPGDRDFWLRVGCLAFALLIMAELMLGHVLFRMSIGAIVADLFTLTGGLSFLAQSLMIIFPALAAGCFRTSP
jgi:hypothetical protein